MLGKYVSDLQDDIEITNTGFSGENSVVNGTLHYVTGYTDFSPGTPELQEGNYLVLRVDTEDEADEITVELTGGIVDHPVTLDSDRNIVLRITNPKTQLVKVVVNHINEDLSVSTSKTTLSLKGLVCEEED